MSSVRLRSCRSSLVSTTDVSRLSTTPIRTYKLNQFLTTQFLFQLTITLQLSKNWKLLILLLWLRSNNAFHIYVSTHTYKMLTKFTNTGQYCQLNRQTLNTSTFLSISKYFFVLRNQTFCDFSSSGMCTTTPIIEAKHTVTDWAYSRNSTDLLQISSIFSHCKYL